MSAISKPVRRVFVDQTGKGSLSEKLMGRTIASTSFESKAASLAIVLPNSGSKLYATSWTKGTKRKSHIPAVWDSL